MACREEVHAVELRGLLRLELACNHLGVQSNSIDVQDGLKLLRDPAEVRVDLEPALESQLNLPA